MMRKKDFDRHVQSVQELLDSDDDEEWDEELASMDKPDTNIEDINGDDVAPPSYGYINGERGLGTSKSESLEERLCAIMEAEMMKKDWSKGGGSLKAIQKITPIGTASKHTPPSDKQKEDGEVSAREIRQASEPAKKYNRYRDTLDMGDKSEDSEETEETKTDEVE